MHLTGARQGRCYPILLIGCLLAACGGGDEGGGIADISLSATARSSTQIALSWSEPDGIISFSPYVIARADDNSSSRITSTSSRNYLVGGLFPGTLYCFEIRTPLTGTRASNVACATTQEDRSPPAPPSDVSALGKSVFSIEVSWVAPFDESGIESFRIFRDGTLIATQGSERFLDDGLLPVTSHCYRVSAIDGSGNESGQSSEACATTLEDVASPSAPTRVGVEYSTEAGIATVTVSWSPSSDDSGIAGYTVFREGVPISETTRTSFADTAIEPDRTYCYSVQATDILDKTSPLSNEVCTRTSWTKRSLGVTGAGSATIALDASDIPYVAYKARMLASDSDPLLSGYRSTLNLVRIGDTLQTELLDASYAEDYIWGDVSMDMALDAAGNAHIVHQSNPTPSSETLQYVVRSLSRTDSVNVQPLDPPLGGVDLVIDGNGLLHGCIEFEGNLHYGNTESGAWTFTALDGLVAGASGNSCSIAVDASNAVHIAYIETFSNDLYYASNISGNWSSARIDAQSGTSTNTIYHTAIATDSAGFAHIVYAHDFAENDLEYATNASGSWFSQKVDDAGTVGYASDIAIDSADRVYVLYEALTDGRPLYLATRDGGAWGSIELSTSQFGQDLSMSVDSTDVLHIVFNNENGELSYLTNQRR